MDMDIIIRDTKIDKTIKDNIKKTTITKDKDINKVKININDINLHHQVNLVIKDIKNSHIRGIKRNMDLEMININIIMDIRDKIKIIIEERDHSLQKKIIERDNNLKIIERDKINTMIQNMIKDMIMIVEIIKEIIRHRTIRNRIIKSLITRALKEIKEKIRISIKKEILINIHLIKNQKLMIIKMIIEISTKHQKDVILTHKSLLSETGKEKIIEEKRRVHIEKEIEAERIDTEKIENMKIEI